MGALHFLEHEFALADYFTEGLAHDLELYETGGELFLRLWIGGRGADMPVLCRLSQDQAKELAEGANRLAGRVAPP